VTQAIFGLIGVIVGALVTGGLSFVRDKREESADLRAALRIVEDDFHLLWMGLKAIAEANAWHPLLRTFELASWPEHRGILARHLDANDWLRVSVGASIFTAARSAAERAFAGHDGDDPPPLSSDDRVLIEKGIADLGEIIEAMQSLHSPKPNLIGLYRWNRERQRRERRRADQAQTESASPGRSE